MKVVIATVIDETALVLKKAGIKSAKLDARIIVATCIGIELKKLNGYIRKKINKSQLNSIKNLTSARLLRKPIDKILGKRGFWTLDFEVTQDTMSPRPDSESLIEAIIKLCPERYKINRLLDLGTGTGCLLLSLLEEYPAAWGVGVDLDPRTLTVAIKNAALANLQTRCSFLAGDWAHALNGIFDIIVSNPPYIPVDDIKNLEPEVAHFDPILALNGGLDGLDCYRRIVSIAPRLLKSDSLLVFEAGFGQDEDIRLILKSGGFQVVHIENDLNNCPRAICAKLFS